MTIDIKSIPFESVRSVYTGKARHCCCGCAGKYTYVKQYQEESSKSRGYPVEDHEVNTTAAKRIFNQIVNDPDAVYDEAYGFISVETETRLKVAYLKN